MKTRIIISLLFCSRLYSQIYIPIDSVIAINNGKIITREEMKPTAQVYITGKYIIDSTLTANYYYEDLNGDIQGEAFYQWYRSNDSIGTGAIRILGQTNNTYVLTSQDSAKWIYCYVWPNNVNQNGDSISSARDTPNNYMFYMKSVQPATLNQLSILLQITTSRDVWIDWGEDDPVKITANAADQTVTSDYGTNNKTYNIKIVGDIKEILKFYISAEATCSGINSTQIKKFKKLNYLRLVAAGTCIINSSDLNALLLNTFYLQNSGTGNIINSSDFIEMPLSTWYVVNAGTSNIFTMSDFSNMPLTTFYIYGTGAMGNLSDLPTTLSTFGIEVSKVNITDGTMKAWTNAPITLTGGYTTAEIDGFLNAWAPIAGTSTKNIDLRGTNQARSSASDTAVTTLGTKGKTILTNP
jgi:hypothetical protein